MSAYNNTKRRSEPSGKSSVLSQKSEDGFSLRGEPRVLVAGQKPRDC